MIAYASRTGTKRNLDALHQAGWHLLVSAAGALRPEGFPYALDNGAWSAFQQHRPFDEAQFALALARLGADAEWVVAPDIVAGGQASLGLSLAWLSRCQSACARVLLAVQDGMVPADVAPYLSATCGLFVGGTTAWKLQTLAQWGALGREVRCWVHVGRVNTITRVQQCVQAHVTSFDGSSASRYAVTVRPLTRAMAQLPLW